MKKLFITILAVLAFAVAASAQSKSIGVRGGIPGLNNDFQVSYEHYMMGENFLEVNAGLDYGWDGDAGFLMSGIYNFMIAQPDWSRGEWGFYAGPGAFLGYVDDKIQTDIEVNGHAAHASGLAFGITGQVGLEYTFWFPLQLSVDIRPYYGFHINGEGDHGYKSKIGPYDIGTRGFYPTISARYRF